MFPVAEPWLGWWRLTAAMTWGGLASLAQLADPKPLRAAWSASATQTVDRYLRSPEFLDLMARNLETMAALTRVNPQPLLK